MEVYILKINFYHKLGLKETNNTMTFVEYLKNIK